MAFCKNCGAQVTAGDRFCANCGHAVESQPVEVTKLERKRNSIPKIAYIIAFLAIVGVVSAVLLSLGVPWKATVSGELTIADDTQPSELVLGDGTTAVVPPGSLPEGATIAVSRLAPAEAPELPAGFNRAELIYDISADQPLQKAITLRIMMPEITGESIFQLSRYRNGQWEPVPFVAKDGFAIVETDTLSLWGWLNMHVGKLSEQVDEAIMAYANPDRYIDWYEEVTGLAKYMELPLEGSSELINYDDSKARALISASARIVDGDKIRLRIHNETKLYLQISFDGPTPVEPKSGAYIDAKTVGQFVNTLMIPPITLDREDIMLLPEGTAEFITNYVPSETLRVNALFGNVAAIFSSLDPALGLVPIADLEMVTAIRDTLGEGDEFVRTLPDIETGWSEKALDLLGIVEAISRTGVLAGEKAIKTLANMLIVPAAVDIREKYLEGRATDIINKGADAKLGGTITISYLAETAGAGGKIVFVRLIGGTPELVAIAIYMMNPDGSDQVRLTDATAPQFFPVWSPDGRKIAYLLVKDYDGAEWVVDVVILDKHDSKRRVVATSMIMDFDDVGSGFPLAWSPDGSNIAFWHRVQDNWLLNLTATDANVSDSRVIATVETGVAPQYPLWITRNKIAYAWRLELHIVHVDDGREDTISLSDMVPAAAESLPAGLMGLVDSLSTDLSPDGENLAVTWVRNYHHREDFKGPRPPRESGIVLIDIAGGRYGGYRQLADAANMGAYQELVWSPDGSRLAFGYYPWGENSKSLGGRDIGIIDADGSKFVNLTNGSGENGLPSWSPDGTKIVFQSVRDGAPQIYVMNADGTNLVQLTDSEDGNGFPAWSPLN